ncbi:lytic murein transglycosylase [Streptomyces sp. CA-294286]|uniref:lytic transglycosylase domain-containing protein n=1 Tax=Streptomyces sp. CA-294286 TaxID=3240070 RepID=UPI003D91E674
MAAQFGRRLRKGATTTAVAAIAVAALSASQAPGAPASPYSGQAAGAQPAPESAASGNSPYYTDLPPLSTPREPGTGTDKPGTGGTTPAGEAEAGLPATVLDAYKKAQAAVEAADPSCRLPWQLLAAIGKVESGHARGGQVDAQGNTTGVIRGPVLNGIGFANIRDTDDGEFDGDTTYDRAVGPMQFIPSTWARNGKDGNGDGRKDPNNIYDAALAAGHYLCAGSRDMTNPEDRDKAILSYNRSREYLRTVLSWFDYYNRGTHEVPDGTGVQPVTPEPDSHRGTPVGAGSAGQGTKPGTSTPTPPPAPGTPTPPAPGGKPTPTPPTSPPTSPPTTPPTTTPTTPAGAARLVVAGGQKPTAVAGGKFAARPAVRTLSATGKPVAGIKVVFTVVGATEARFPGNALRTAVTTGKDGLATAPVLAAGDKAGSFVIRATAPGAPAAEFWASVTAKPAPAPKADTLVRTSDTEVEAEAGTVFATAIEVRVTADGKALAGAKVSAVIVGTKGPYFKAEDGTAVRTLGALTTDTDGTLTLPELYADDAPGTYVLRIVADGVVLNVELTVTAKPTTPPTAPPTQPPTTTPTTPTQTPTGSASPTGTATP